MPIYYGKSEDGSDMKEFEGFHVSPCGKFWGSEPFVEPKKKRDKHPFSKFMKRGKRK